MEELKSEDCYKELKDLILSILEVVWLSEDVLDSEPFYRKELEVHWFWFDTLLWVLMKHYKYSDKIYSFFRWEEYSNPLERLTKLKEFLLELEKWKKSTKDRVTEVIK